VENPRVEVRRSSRRKRTVSAYRDGDTIVNVLTAGDVFGEMAFLLEQPRSFDVDAATAGTRVLSLSDGAMRKMISEDSALAAKVLLNVSKLLCVKLLRAS